MAAAGTGHLTRTILCLVLLAAVLLVAAVQAQESGPAAVSPADTDAVQRALAAMSPRAIAGQLVVGRVSGRRTTAAERRALRAGRIGGVIFFGGNYSNDRQFRALTGQLQRLGAGHNVAGAGMLTLVDQEGGPVKRIPAAPPRRSPAQLRRTGTMAVARSEGARTGRALSSLGVNVNLAPVADLDAGPGRIMASRSFGSRPGRVAVLASAFAQGLQSAGVAATVKHFPGLGAASANTDFAPGKVELSRARMAQHLRPFRRAIDDGVQLVMVSHAVYPAYHRGRPATTSARVTRRLLRRDLGFEGVAVSDALEARGLVRWQPGDLGTRCVAAVAAGIDLLLVTSGAEPARSCAAALDSAVREGRLSQARLNEAATRVLLLKRRLGLLP